MQSFKKLSAYADVPCEWASAVAPRNDEIDQLKAENAKLREENERLKLFAKGDAIITDYWKDEDGTMHVLTTDGSSTYEYMRGGLAEENAKLRKLCADLRFCRRHNCLTCSHGRFCDMGFDERCAKLSVEVPDE